jgi:mRNA interferase MazF
VVPPAPGSVVLVRFPFSNLSQSKLRPAVVLAGSGRGDWILCQITSKTYGDPRAVRIEASNFQSSALRVASYVRPGKLFTANRDLIAGRVGQLKPEAYRGILDSVVTLLRSGGAQ